MKFKRPRLSKFFSRGKRNDYPYSNLNYDPDNWESYYITSGSRNLGSKKKKRLLPTLYRIAVVLAVLLVVVTIRETQHPLGIQAREGLKYLLTTEWNFQPALDKAVQLGLRAVNMDMPFHNDLSGASPALSSNMADQYSLPVSGRVIKRYGWGKDPDIGLERFNPGIFIECKPGSSVRAARDGRVARVGEDQTLGTFVLLEHGRGNYTMYAGLSRVVVKENQQVEKEAVIGVIDENSKGLHFEIRENNKLVDPLPKLQELAE
ncbi:MAG: M23 family metallopeptidase [Desulfotomaculum sp.]|nr:M23 family metallopeptidase [Desulfotomaculum sp.]